MMTIELLRQGLAEHHAGRLEAAAGLYRAALEHEPDNVSALRCLGVLRSQQGDFQAALLLLQAAARFAPEMPEIFNDLGSTLRQKGALNEAVLAFDEAIRLQPVFAEAYFNRGLTFEALGCVDRAMDSYDLALQADPLRGEARFNRAAIRVRAGEFTLALPDLVEFLRQQPASEEAGLMLGRVYRELGRWNEAENIYRGLSEGNPDKDELWLLHGTCCLVLQRYEEAARSLTHALDGNPDLAEAQFKAGVAQLHLWNCEGAVRHLKRAFALKPDSVDVVLQLAVALQRNREFADADAAFQHALSLAPENADVHWSYADFLLLLGDYRRGWEEFEWRWHHERFVTPKWRFPQPEWHGEDIRGKTILLLPEQGFGDMLQFVRYIPMVAASGAKVLLGTPPELARLLADFPGTQGVYLAPNLLPSFDVHCPLLSLPRIFNTDVDTIPARVPYLRVHPSVVRPWAQYFARFKTTVKVGLIWSGNPAQENNRHRACRLADLFPLMSTKNVTLFSLQKGAPASELHTASSPVPVTDLSPRLGDFAETAAVMEHLDLLISTDTGPIHLAGGLGRPVWLMLSAIPDWRWMIGRQDSPWYPGMRLFRQTRAGDWSDVVERVANDLAAFVAMQHFPSTMRGEV
jgi:tetratricopeptide (TPR) repeat protein